MESVTGKIELIERENLEWRDLPISLV